MTREDVSFSAFKTGDIEHTKLEEQINAEAKLPKLSHIETLKVVGEDGTVSLIFEAELTEPQRSALAKVVAAHDSDAAALELTKEMCKAVIDARTAYCHAIRELAAMTQRQVDNVGKSTKDAIDGAKTVEDCIAAADADPRTLPEAPK